MKIWTKTMIYEGLSAGERDLPEKYISFEDANLMLEEMVRENNRTLASYLAIVIELKDLIKEYKELIEENGRAE